jgi:hypothetical protein
MFHEANYQAAERTAIVNTSKDRGLVEHLLGRISTCTNTYTQIRHLEMAWLIIIINSFLSCSRMFHLDGDVTITGEGLQNLGLCSALRAFEQGGIFIVSHLLWHGASVFGVRPIRSPFTTRKGMRRTYSNLYPQGCFEMEMQCEDEHHFRHALKKPTQYWFHFSRLSVCDNIGNYNELSIYQIL